MTQPKMLRVGGKPFRCECGCNVFHPKTETSTGWYVCNACGAEYASHDMPMTQPSLAEQAREWIDEMRTLPSGPLDELPWTREEAMARIEKLADELERTTDELSNQLVDEEAHLSTMKSLGEDRQRLTDAVTEVVESLIRIEDYCRARFNVSGYTSDEVMASILRNYVDPLLAKHRPVATEEDR